MSTLQRIAYYQNRRDEVPNQKLAQELAARMPGFGLGYNSYGARVTDTALGTIRSVEATVQGFEERAAKLETDIADVHKRGQELETKVGAPFEHEERYQELCRRQSEIEEKLDLTKNQAPSQVEASSAGENEEKNSKKQEKNNAVRPKHRMKVSV